MMKKEMRQWYVAAALMTVFGAIANAGFKDDFTDGNRDGWWKLNNDASYTLTVADDSAGIGSGNALFFNNTSTSIRRLITGFDTVTLGMDEHITLSFDLRLSAVVDTNKGLRFGLYDDAGTPVDADYSGGNSGPAAYDKGYYVRLSTGTTASMDIVKDYDADMLGGSDVTTTQYSVASHPGINDTQKHHIEYTIQHVTGGIHFKFSVDGQSVVDTFKATTDPFVVYNEFGIASYSNGIDFVIDNVSVTSLAELTAAHDPTPADNTIGVSPNATLSWYTALDPTDLESVNAAVTKHYVYLKEGDPNFAGESPVATVSAAYAGEPTASYTPSLDVDKTYYWRVDESVNNSGPADPNTITGDVWTFGTQSQALIVTPPSSTIAAPAGTAEFVIEVSSLSTPHYAWYKTGDAANDTPGDDSLVGGDADTLTLTGVSVAHEGYYYCVVSNASPFATVSDVVMLGVKRPVAHWTLDELIGGQYEDISGEGHNADPNGTPAFVTGAIGNGIQIDGSSAADGGTWNPGQYTNQFTVSLWAKWAGQTTPATYQGLIAKRNGWAGDQMMWQVEVSQTSNNMGFKTAPSASVFSRPLTVGEWELVTVTFDGSRATIYHNGLVAGAGGFTPGTKTDATIVIGASELSEGVFEQYFNGVLDDIRIYNYAMSNTEIADLYHAVTGESVCILGYATEYDYDDNCLVNLADLAVFVSAWLDCGLYPASGCHQ